MTYSKIRQTLREAVARLGRLRRKTTVVHAQIVQISYGSLLHSRNVLVTGGSAGIGLAIAKKAIKEGAKVVITGRSADRLANAAAAIDSPALSTLVWDVKDISAISQKLAECQQLLGGSINVLVNNAGLLVSQTFFTTTEAGWEETYSVNSKGPFFLTQALSQDWINNRQRGKIINICSTGGFLGAPYPYRMTKWDMVGFTKGVAEILAPHGIIVNGIAPGRTATDMLNRSATADLTDSHQPLKRMATPEEIAEIAIFLMSDATNYIVGHTIICDGGYTLKL